MLAIPRAAGSASTTESNARSPRSPSAHRPALRDREDGAVALGCVGDGTVPVLVDDGVGERPERRDERPLETRFDADQIAEQADRVSGVRPEEPRAGRLLDVAPPGLEQVDPRLMPARDVLEPFDLLGQRSPLLLELRPPVGERRDLPVHALDVRLEALPLVVERRDPRRDIREAFVQTLPFALGRRDAAAERLHLGAAPGGLLAHPAPDVLDLAAVLLGLAERLLRAVQLVLAAPRAR